ncbi:MAG: leucine-rich repeat domain-containing protein [Acholeplasmatales bacterium]|nr:leucine-rich repeat domain-containing protein [Acholeplasmatales bacterium]
MTLDKEIIYKFLRANKELIIENSDLSWQQFYKNALPKTSHLNAHVGEVTDLLFKSKVRPDYVLTVLPEKFLSHSEIDKYHVPYGMTHIGPRAFNMCEKLINVSISNSVESIGEYCFNGCHSLTDVTIGSSVKNVGEWAFWYCNKLKEVAITCNDFVMEDYSFCNCGDNLKIFFQGTKEQWRKVYNKKAFLETYFVCECFDGKIVKKKR